MTVRSRSMCILVLLAAGVACTASRDEGRDHRASQADTSSAASPAMPGMQHSMSGMTPGAGSEAMMSEMRQHLGVMQTARVDSLVAMLPTHRQMVANMISTFNTEMRGMNMSGDAAWQATVDSLRLDLVRMPAMSPAELRDFFPTHARRVTRLMESHHAMMSSMNM